MSGIKSERETERGREGGRALRWRKRTRRKSFFLIWLRVKNTRRCRRCRSRSVGRSVGRASHACSQGDSAEVNHRGDDAEVGPIGCGSAAAESEKEGKDVLVGNPPSSSSASLAFCALSLSLSVRARLTGVTSQRTPSLPPPPPLRHRLLGQVPDKELLFQPQRRRTAETEQRRLPACPPGATNACGLPIRPFF